MAAAAFLAYLVFKDARTGTPLGYNCTVSDITAGFYVFPDGNTDVVLPSNGSGWILADLILSAAGTDTRTANIFVNGRIIPVAIQNAANLATNLSRQFLSAPIGIASGARVRFTQVT